MALIKCPECKKDISEKAESCPNCSYKFSQNEKIRIKEEGQQYLRNGAIGCLVIIVVVVIIFKTCNNGSTDAPPIPWNEQDNSMEAYTMVEDWVKERLVSPATAKFPIGEIRNHTHRGNGQTYSIKSYVDSQNRMGGLMRTHFTAEVEKISEEKWKLIDLKFLE